MAIAEQTLADWSSRIRSKALVAAKELASEDILKWTIPEQDTSKKARGPFCSVTVLSRFSKEPLALWQSGSRGEIYGDLDLSKAIGPPKVNKYEGSTYEFVRWKELDDGRVGRVEISARIENADTDDKERGIDPKPQLCVIATPIRYDDYHKGFEHEYPREKMCADPDEAFEVFLALLIQNAANPQCDVRMQDDSFQARSGETREKIVDRGEFEMGLLED